MFLLLAMQTLFCFPYNSFATFDDCKKHKGKEIVLDVCIPDRYDKMSPPVEHPTIVQVNFRITGFKSVDLLSNTFSIYVTINRLWRDSRIQVNWSQNHTLKYLSDKINDKIWLPWILNPHFLGQTMTERKIILHRKVTIFLIFM